MTFLGQIWRILVSRLFWLIILGLYLAALAVLGLGIWFSEISLERAEAAHAAWWVQTLEGMKVAALVILWVFVAVQPVIALVEGRKTALWRHERRSDDEP